MKVEDIKFQSAQHVLDEIYNMNVKGGSPFGRAAAWAYKLACEQEALDSFGRTGSAYAGAFRQAARAEADHGDHPQQLRVCARSF